MKLSVVIITKNEESNIGRCLDSVHWADEVVVLDSGSDDRTVDICRERGCRVHIDAEWKGFGRAKRKVVDLAANDWILSIDADEVLTEALQREIRDLVSCEPRFTAYGVKRNAYYLGRKMRYSGWNRDYPVRIFDRRHAAFNEKTVHESVSCDGRIGRLVSAMEHFPYRTLSDHLIKMERYAELSSRAMYAEGKRSDPLCAIVRGKMKFVKMYFMRFGFLDGSAGLTLAINSAWGVYLKYIRLWELGRQGR